MAVFLSPGVFPREIDLSIVPTAVGALTPAFIGTAKKGPVQTPTFISNAQQFIDTFGEPFSESYLGYAVTAYFEEGNRAWVLRVGVECEEGQPSELADICIDTSGARGHGWGRLAIFSGIDFGKICTRVISADAPLSFHRALIDNIDYNDILVHPTDGPASATLDMVNIHSYTGPIDDSYTVLITGDPTLTGGSLLDGATYEITRNSDGATVLVGTIIESLVPGRSEVINIGDNISFAIVVIGSVAIATNDTFTFTVRPDNRVFSFNVDRQGTIDSAVPGAVVQYTIPDGFIYTTNTDFADAINALIPSNEPYLCVAKSDETACFQTDVAGRNIQLESTEAFALEIGTSLYAYDVPRSYLMSTETGPYIISSENNRVSQLVIGQTETTEVNFSLPVGSGITGAILAASINLGGTYAGVKYWRSYVMYVPGGEEQIFIEASLDHQFDQLKLQADLSHFKTLRFAEELVILFPYTRAYRVFEDPRVILPDAGQITPNMPLSCEVDPLSDECAADSAYYQNIVGWLVATSPGTWIDDYKFTMSIFDKGEGTSISVSGRFQIIILDSSNNTIETIDDVSFNPLDERYISNVINPGSSIGGFNGNSFLNWIPRPAFLNTDPINDPANFENRVPGSFNNQLSSGGANGIPSDPAYSSEVDRSIIGNPAAETGIFAFQNPEVYDITLLIIPGASSGAVIGQGLQMCEARGDVMMLIDPPFGLRAQQVVDWHNGILYSDLAQAINSSYGALYHPWLKIFDQYSGDNIFIPPSGHVSSVYARTARVAEQWFAPAGLQRGHLLTPLDVEVDLTLGERDLMYGFGNAVNPIVNFPQDGITVWGQRTLQRRQSALDRVNVRLLLIFIKKNATRFLRQFVFEPNDKITRAQIVNISVPFLADIQARRGLQAFNVVCDDRNNTPERIDRNELHVAYFLKPTRAAEFIVLNLVVLRTNASFSAEEILAAGGVVAG
jgi:phage tail sheath protein FI